MCIDVLIAALPVDSKTAAPARQIPGNGSDLFFLFSLFVCGGAARGGGISKRLLTGTDHVAHETTYISFRCWV